MPELPEVETVRRSLVDHVIGRTITGASVTDFPGVLGDDPDATTAALTGRVIEDVRRRGKYLLILLDDGTYMVVHLRMTGQLLLSRHNQPPARFQHLAILLDDGNELRFADQRKFGRVLHASRETVAALDVRLGPEPLTPSFTASKLGEIVRRRPGKIKSVILDQHAIAGLGNIYADEALFRARIHPERPASSLTTAEIGRLHRAIRASLGEAIVNRGTTFSSFLDGYGASGDNAHNLRVYGRGRGGEPCDRCGTALTLTIVGGRSSHFCPRCQPFSLPTGGTELNAAGGVGEPAAQDENA
ncbi:MAG TPA: bifunctional DNA-formamidopyrimidine glycosylase/DNA-(apurinic or apyrimidinic site) lyase [Thermomicrobiales bacterium]|nr:bifunctional DNA-formamidopyrimidine glycosylase/DNA-(apurinic or apyrimidinic site) lyase [Thermomicrobiales bacterium]